MQAWLAGRGAPLDFAVGYAHAKRQQIEAMAEDIVDIASDETLDANERRLQVDTRKWLLSKLIPKTYGDKLDLTSDGKTLPSNSVAIDQRVQSIIAMAAARRSGSVELVTDGLDANALKMLE